MTFQPNISIFDFEGASVRMDLRGDEPWFVLNDVCAVLEIKQAHHAAASLDDDEKGRANITTLGGPQDVTIINESGLYSLILRSRKPVAKRFKKWVTSEVLPTLRRTGVYAMIDSRLEPADDTQVFGMSTARVNAASKLIAVARAIYGERAARRLWEAEPDLPHLSDLALEAIPDGPDDNPAGCFRHLMQYSAGNGMTVKSLFLLALNDQLAAGRLRRLGISMDPHAGNGFVAIANSHPFLAEAFGGTQWTGDWTAALCQLPNARPTKTKVSFGQTSSKAVMVPRSEAMALIYG